MAGFSPARTCLLSCKRWFLSSQPESAEFSFRNHFRVNVHVSPQTCAAGQGGAQAHQVSLLGRSSRSVISPASTAHPPPPLSLLSPPSVSPSPSALHPTPARLRMWAEGFGAVQHFLPVAVLKDVFSKENSVRRVHTNAMNYCFGPCIIFPHTKMYVLLQCLSTYFKEPVLTDQG